MSQVRDDVLNMSLMSFSLEIFGLFFHQVWSQISENDQCYLETFIFFHQVTNIREYFLPENIDCLSTRGLLHIINIDVVEIFFVDINGIVLFDTMFHDLKKILKILL